MAMAQLPHSCSVYLDNTVLVDLIDNTERRHRTAHKLLSLFQRHQNLDSFQRHQNLGSRPFITVITSEWTITEAYSHFYKKELEQSGVSLSDYRGNSKDARYVLPPDHVALAASYAKVDNLILNTLQTTTTFQLWPGNRDTTPIWQLHKEISRQTGIWPTDSMHLAIALDSDCSMLITDDGDLLDKIDHCQNLLIQPYLQQKFSLLPTIPTFDAHAISPSPRSKIPTQPIRVSPSAIQALNALGFR